MDEKRIKRKNSFKVIRSVLETLIILAVVLWGLWSLVEYRRLLQRYYGESPGGRKNCHEGIFRKTD